MIVLSSFSMKVKSPIKAKFKLIIELEKPLKMIPQTKVLSLKKTFHLPPSKDISLQRDQQLCIHHISKVDIIPLQQVIYIQSESNYNRVFLDSGISFFHSRTLKLYEKELVNYGFIRTHRSYLLNSRFVKTIDKVNNIILMVDNSPFPLSKSRKKSVLAFFQPRIKN